MTSEAKTSSTFWPPVLMLHESDRFHPITWSQATWHYVEPPSVETLLHDLQEQPIRHVAPWLFLRHDDSSDDDNDDDDERLPPKLEWIALPGQQQQHVSLWLESPPTFRGYGYTHVWNQIWNQVWNQISRWLGWTESNASDPTTSYRWHVLIVDKNGYRWNQHENKPWPPVLTQQFQHQTNHLHSLYALSPESHDIISLPVKPGFASPRVRLRPCPNLHHQHQLPTSVETTRLSSPSQGWHAEGRRSDAANTSSG